MRVVIVGAGVAGLACALALRQLGLDCRLFERAPCAGADGMGFLMTPEVRGQLQALGLPADAVPCSPLHGISLQDPGADDAVSAGLPVGCAGASRAALMQALRRAWGDAARVRHGSAVAHWEIASGGRSCLALLEDRSAVRGELFVGADGARSLLRRQLFPGTSAVPARVQEFVGLAQAPGLGRGLGSWFRKLHCRARGLAFGHLPVDEDQAVWFLQFDAQRHAAWTRPGAPPPGQLLQEALAHWPAPVAALLGATGARRIHHWQPLDAELPPVLARGRLVLAGDAAAPLLPFTSQGVSAALADALALRDALRGVRAEGDLANALARYDALRRPPRARLLDQGRRLAREFLAPRPEGGAPRWPVVFSDDLLGHP